jgi:hypothetical protein
MLVMAMVVAGLWLMEQGGAEPAARANGAAPDPAEEKEVRELMRARERERKARPPSFLVDAPAEVVARD